MPLRRGSLRSKSALARVARTGTLACVVLSGVVSPDARAGDEKGACIRAVDRAQVARLDGKLREAREGLATCARAICPAAIREDCTRWLGEVEASLPSVVFEATWADGRSATGWRVSIDGEPLADSEPGHPVTLDLGSHIFHYEVAGAPPVEMRTLIYEAEKSRVLHVTFTPTAPPAPGPAPVVPAQAPASAPTPTPAPAAALAPVREARRPIPVPAYVFGGVALVGLGGFAYLGLTGTSQLDTMRSTCVHSCNPGDVSAARNQILVGDILGFVALAAAGVATWLIVTRPAEPAGTGK